MNRISSRKIEETVDVWRGENVKNCGSINVDLGSKNRDDSSVLENRSESRAAIRLYCIDEDDCSFRRTHSRRSRVGDTTAPMPTNPSHTHTASARDRANDTSKKHKLKNVFIISRCC